MDHFTSFCLARQVAFCGAIVCFTIYLGMETYGDFCLIPVSFGRSKPGMKATTGILSRKKGDMHYRCPILIVRSSISSRNNKGNSTQKIQNMCSKILCPRTVWDVFFTFQKSTRNSPLTDFRSSSLGALIYQWVCRRPPIKKKQLAPIIRQQFRSKSHLASL